MSFGRTNEVQAILKECAQKKKQEMARHCDKLGSTEQMKDLTKNAEHMEASKAAKRSLTDATNSRLWTFGG